MDVKWIKVYTDMVSNKKIKRIRTLPEGNNIVLIWVLLLAQAGESNKSGALYLTDTLAFRPEDLAVEFDFEIAVINLALIILEKYSMIEVFDEVIYIKNWGEYQNIEGLGKIQEQSRLSSAKYRQRQKEEQLLVADSDRHRDVTVTVGDRTELELDIELDKELDIDTKKSTVKKTKSEIGKILFGEKVHLSEVEHGKLVENNGEQVTAQMIEILDNWYCTKGNKPNKSDYHTMVGSGWVVKRFNEDQRKQSVKDPGDKAKSKTPSNKYDSFYL